MADAELHSPGNPLLSRRSLLATGAAGAAAYGLTAARARGAVPMSLVSQLAGTVTFGSNASDPVPKKATAAVLSAFTKQTGIKVEVNTVDHNTFQEQINTYLQGTPDDVFTWFAGYRMQFFAAKGLAGDISDVWANTTGFSDYTAGFGNPGDTPLVMTRQD